MNISHSLSLDREFSFCLLHCGIYFFGIEEIAPCGIRNEFLLYIMEEGFREGIETSEDVTAVHTIF